MPARARCLGDLNWWSISLSTLHMSTQFSQDLRLARRKTGFKQSDLAHFLDLHQSSVSDLEHGKHRPSLDQIIALSLIYGRSFESLFAELMAEQRARLAERLATLPMGEEPTAQTFNRSASLKRPPRPSPATIQCWT